MFQDIDTDLAALRAALRNYDETNFQDSLHLLRMDIKRDLKLHGESVERKLDHALYKSTSELIEAILGGFDQATCKTRFIEVDVSKVSEELRGLRSKTRSIHQQVILDDTILCLEAGAYRAAIVMGWNFAFDHLREWIFKSKRKRLKDFNATLITKKGYSGQPFVKVSTYPDFFDIGESLLLRVAKEAKLITDNQWKFLTGMLNTRNQFAHPSTRKASDQTAVAYIDDLLLNVINDTHYS